MLERPIIHAETLALDSNLRRIPDVFIVLTKFINTLNFEHVTIFIMLIYGTYARLVARRQLLLSIAAPFDTSLRSRVAALSRISRPRVSRDEFRPIVKGYNERQRSESKCTERTPDDEYELGHEGLR